MEVNIFYGGFRSKAGGAFNHASSIEKEFLEIGWKVTIVTLDSLPVWCRYLPHLVQRSINYIRLPFGFLFKAYITKSLYEFFFNNNVDLRIFEDIYIAWDSNIPSVTVLHAVWSDNFQAYSIKESQLKKFKTSETSLINKLLQPVITVSQPYLNYLLHDHFLGDISKDINVIELGIDQAEFIKYKRSVKNNKKIIYTGALEARKNLFFLLEVMNELIKADSTYSLTLVGDGPDRFLLEKYVKKNDLPVSFLGKLKHAQVVSELFNHSIYVHTSVKVFFFFIA